LKLAPKGAEGATRRATIRQRVDARVELITMAREGEVTSAERAIDRLNVPTAVCERVEGGRGGPE